VHGILSHAGVLVLLLRALPCGLPVFFIIIIIIIIFFLFLFCFGDSDGGVRI
jgi:hypothetical protein